MVHFCECGTTRLVSSVGALDGLLVFGDGGGKEERRLIGKKRILF